MDDFKTSPVSFFLTPLCITFHLVQRLQYAGHIKITLHGFLQGAKPFFSLLCLSPQKADPWAFLLHYCTNTDTLHVYRSAQICARTGCPVSTFWPPSFHLSLRFHTRLASQREQVTLTRLIKICSLPSQISCQRLWWEDTEIKLSSGRVG